MIDLISTGSPPTDSGGALRFAGPAASVTAAERNALLQWCDAAAGAPATAGDLVGLRLPGGRTAIGDVLIPPADRTTSPAGDLPPMGWILAAEPTLARFGHHPLRLRDAVAARTDVARRLAGSGPTRISLEGASLPVSLVTIEAERERGRTGGLLAAVEALLHGATVRLRPDGEPLVGFVDAVIGLLPQASRRGLTFSALPTGDAARDVDLAVADGTPARGPTARRGLRFVEPRAAESAPLVHPWARRLAAPLRAGRLGDVLELLIEDGRQTTPAAGVRQTA